MSDQNTRTIVVGKDCYAKYCATCPFLIFAQWAERNGYRYSVMEIICCKQGGRCHVDNSCPHGVAWDYCLGQEFRFNPDDMRTTEKERVMIEQMNVAWSEHETKWNKEWVDKTKDAANDKRQRKL